MKVSVIIPVYNKAKYLNTLFNCLISQTFTEFECIFVDDGSTDESGALCDAFSVNDKRFRIIHTKTPFGEIALKDFHESAILKSHHTHGYLMSKYENHSI